MTSKKRHSRRSIRLRAYDYTQPGGYFVTIGTFRMQHTLARIDQGQVHLSPIGNIVLEEWFITARLRPYIRLEPEEFVIMTNHIHGILWIVEAVPNPEFKPGAFKLMPDSLGAVIGQFKSAVTKRVNRLLGSRINVWHTNYYEHIVRDDHNLKRIQQYIRNNPAAWTRNRQRPLRQRPHSGDMIMQSHPVLQQKETPMTSSERSEKIKLYGDAHRILTEALERFPRDMWRYKPSASDWSIHEIVLHITDSEANSYVRARRIIAEPGLHLMAYDENQWGERLDYHHLDTGDAVELFRWLRGLTHKLIQTLPENTWGHRAFHPEIGPITLDDWLDTYAAHVPDHVSQMEAVFAAWQAEQT